jgi:hypothetical protein
MMINELMRLDSYSPVARNQFREFLLDMENKFISITCDDCHEATCPACQDLLHIMNVMTRELDRLDAKG